jgi:hypothetical protein
MKIIQLSDTDAKYNDSFFISVEIIDEDGKNIGYSSFIIFINYEKKIINLGNVYKVEIDDIVDNFMSNIKDILLFDVKKNCNTNAFNLKFTCFNNISINENNSQQDLQ